MTSTQNLNNELPAPYGSFDAMGLLQVLGWIPNPGISGLMACYNFSFSLTISPNPKYNNQYGTPAEINFNGSMNLPNPQQGGGGMNMPLGSETLLNCHGTYIMYYPDSNDSGNNGPFNFSCNSYIGGLRGLTIDVFNNENTVQIAQFNLFLDNEAARWYPSTGGTCTWSVQ